MRYSETIRQLGKNLARALSPSYRVALRIEQRLITLEELGRLPRIDMGSGTFPSLHSLSSLRKSAWDQNSLTSNIHLPLACLALEIHETHKAAFLEFKGCHRGRDVVVMATGPSMKYYDPIPRAVHIGVNRAFQNERVKLDYYFATDYQFKDPWFKELRDHHFVKFFGQYPAGEYRDTFQMPEDLILENNARRFFQGAPSEDIHLNIEYYPLMGFYSVAFQAIHFALYTHPRRIFLVGCDCTDRGYFDGKKQMASNPPLWMKGYQKLKEFAARFYPDVEIISLNPVGLRGLFRDQYTRDFLAAHRELDKNQCEILGNSDKE